MLAQVYVSVVVWCVSCYISCSILTREYLFNCFDLVVSIISMNVFHMAAFVFPLLACIFICNVAELFHQSTNRIWVCAVVQRCGFSTYELDHLKEIFSSSNSKYCCFLLSDVFKMNSPILMLDVCNYPLLWSHETLVAGGFISWALFAAVVSFSLDGIAGKPMWITFLSDFFPIVFHVVLPHLFCVSAGMPSSCLMVSQIYLFVSSS